MKKFFFEKPKKLAVQPANYLQLKKIKEGDKRKTAEQQKRLGYNGKAFWIDHYAGPVGYSTVGFLSKNLDKVPDQLIKMMLSSSDSGVCAITGISTGLTDPHGLFTILNVTETVQAPHKDAPAKPKKKSNKRVSQSKKGKATIASQFTKALNSLANTIRKTQPHYVRCVQPNNLKLAAGAGSRWESFDGVKILGQLVRAGLMETIEIRKRGYPFRQSYVMLWETFQESGILKMLRTSEQNEIQQRDDEREQCMLVMKYSLGEDGSKLWSQGKTMLFGKDSLMRTIGEWQQRQCAATIQNWARFQVILRSRTKSLDEAVAGYQRLWRRELQRRRARKAAADSAYVCLMSFPLSFSRTHTHTHTLYLDFTSNYRYVALMAYNNLMKVLKVMYDDVNRASKARREASLNASRIAGAAVYSANSAVIRASNDVEDAKKERKRKEEEERKRKEEEERKRKEEERRRRESSDRKVRLAQEAEDKRRKVEEEERKRQEEAKKRQEEEKIKQQQQQQQAPGPGVMVRQKSKREKLLDKLAKNRSGRGLRQASGRQTSGKGLRQTSGRGGMRNENQDHLPKQERKMTGKDALAMAFENRNNSVSSRDSDAQGLTTPPPRISRHQNKNNNSKNEARRVRRLNLVLRLFNKVEEEYLERKEEREDVFDHKGEIRFECAKTDKLGIRRRRSVILNKKRGVIRTLRPGGKEAKQLAVQRIVSVRQDSEIQCRIIFGSLDEKRKKQKRAHRPYELLFDSSIELKRFLHSLQVVRESAPKRGMSVMKMERLGSFVNLENSIFGT